MIYLDNAATTNYKPKIVVDTVLECLTKYPFNPNRSGKISLPLQQKLFETRKKLSLLFNNGDVNRVIFTSGCTHALNIAIMGLAKKGHVIISATEHNSVLRPLMQLYKTKKITLTIVNPDENGQITAPMLEQVVQKDTFMLCVSQSSNVTGTKQKLFELGQFAKRHNLIFLVDCAQSFGYYPTDMAKNNIDVVAIPSHKGLHGMQGGGALIFSNNVTPKPLLFGGTGSESHLYYQPKTLPDGLEVGTLCCPAILSMNAGIDWWLDNHKQNAKNMEICANILHHGLQQIPDLTIYSKPNASGIVAFNVGNVDSAFVADYLSQSFDLHTRAGLHCAPSMHKYLGTFNQGIVRASVSCVTTKQECYTLLNGVESLIKIVHATKN